MFHIKPSIVSLILQSWRMLYVYANVFFKEYVAKLCGHSVCFNCFKNHKKQNSFSRRHGRFTRCFFLSPLLLIGQRSHTESPFCPLIYNAYVIQVNLAMAFGSANH